MSASTQDRTLASERAIEWIEGAGDDVRKTVFRLVNRRITAVLNQKGGVYKTASTISVAAELAARGVDVLVLDLDPQANTTTGFGLNPDEADATMYEVLHPEPPKRVALDLAAVEVRPNLWVVPGHTALAAIEEYGNGPGGELLLRRAIKQATPRTLTLIDCPPNLGRLTVAAMASGEEVDLMVPVKCGPDELDGLAKLLDSIDKVRDNGLVSELEVRYVYATNYDPRQKVDRGVDDYLARKFPDAYVSTPIRKSVRAVEAKSYKLPIREYAPGEAVVGDYVALARTVVERRLAA